MLLLASTTLPDVALTESLLNFPRKDRTPLFVCGIVYVAFHYKPSRRTKGREGELNASANRDRWDLLLVHGGFVSVLSLSNEYSNVIILSYRQFGTWQLLFKCCRSPCSPVLLNLSRDLQVHAHRLM